MSSRAGETFTTARALADIDGLLGSPLPTSGPTAAEGDPGTGEWTATRGEGFRVIPLWEGEPLTGVYAPEWNDAEEAAEAHLAALVGELDHRWGPHRAVPLHVPLLRRQERVPVEPLFDALLDQDLYGDLAVWGPVGDTDRWVGVSVGHSDGDAPLVLAALVSGRPVTVPDGP
ncbi:hypothetical protein AB0L71_07265 [Streptomyces sp. NPDC052052]|uniref:hypothetical protein n=1 Tax=Streptomyces sp. NPDC052052 TaxID=3154756 RepID=UPI00341D28E0